MEAAMRASMAVRRQEERAMMQERNVFREERKERPEQEEPRHKSGPIKATSKPPGEKWINLIKYNKVLVFCVCVLLTCVLSTTVKTMKSSNLREEEDFPALGAAAPTPTYPMYFPKATQNLILDFVYKRFNFCCFVSL